MIFEVRGVFEVEGVALIEAESAEEAKKIATERKLWLHAEDLRFDKGSARFESIERVEKCEVAA